MVMCLSINEEHWVIVQYVDRLVVVFHWREISILQMVSFENLRQFVDFHRDLSNSNWKHREFFEMRFLLHKIPTENNKTKWKLNEKKLREFTLTRFVLSPPSLIVEISVSESSKSSPPGVSGSKKVNWRMTKLNEKKEKRLGRRRRRRRKNISLPSRRTTMFWIASERLKS